MKINKIILALGLGLVASLSFAQETDFPKKRSTIKLIVPYPPGGPTDGLARRLAQEASKKLDGKMIVENIGGANGNIGAATVAKSKADGYTLMLGTSGPMAINSSLYSNLTYHPVESFEPVINIGSLPNALVVNKKIKANNVQELIKEVKANPDDYTYGSSGIGASSHLAGVLFNRMAATDILHIPYKGTGPALTDLLGNQVSMVFTDVLTALPHVEKGELKALGIASKDGSTAMPDVPPIADQGLDGYDVSVFFVIVGPKGIPEPILKTLNQAFIDTISEEEIQKTLKGQGIVEAEDKSPESLAQFIQNEVDKWAKVIKEENITMD